MWTWVCAQRLPVFYNLTIHLAVRVLEATLTTQSGEISFCKLLYFLTLCNRCYLCFDWVEHPLAAQQPHFHFSIPARGKRPPSLRPGYQCDGQRYWWLSSCSHPSRQWSQSLVRRHGWKGAWSFLWIVCWRPLLLFSCSCELIFQIYIATPFKPTFIESDSLRLLHVTRRMRRRRSSTRISTLGLWNGLYILRPRGPWSHARWFHTVPMLFPSSLHCNLCMIRAFLVEK